MRQSGTKTLTVSVLSVSIVNGAVGAVYDVEMHKFVSPTKLYNERRRSGQE